jgi:hypothetical protein
METLRSGNPQKPVKEFSSLSSGKPGKDLTSQNGRRDDKIWRKSAGGLNTQLIDKLYYAIQKSTH